MVNINRLLFVALPILVFTSYLYGRGVWHPVVVKMTGKKTVADVIATYDRKTEAELSPLFRRAGLSYPPNKLALVAFKDTKIMELWASDDTVHFSRVTQYPIRAASGKPGPKLREGDRQVPEGIYKIVSFNPNSAYHLSMKLNYPNDFDLEHAQSEGRDRPGTNIFIHGRAVSIGCLAMGDSVIEKLFSLVHATGIANTSVIISPTDPSKNKLVPPLDAPSWTSDLYEEIESRIKAINSAK